MSKKDKEINELVRTHDQILEVLNRTNPNPNNSIAAAILTSAMWVDWRLEQVEERLGKLRESD